ncbi:MAG: hypothetical protein IJ632_00325 [Muribaculaceae bacterium]|nr:hypothetical protein [Muribaculaceae bacterium]
MTKNTGTILKATGITLASIAALLMAAMLLLNTDAVQQKILKHATQMLTDKLKTRVSIERASVDLFSQDIRLHNMSVDDRQQRPLLRLEQLQLDVDLWALISHRVVIHKAKVAGLRAELHQDGSDSVPNYQFLIDALAPKHSPDQHNEGNKHPLALDIDQASGERIQILYNENSVTLGRADYKQPRQGKATATVQNLSTAWKQTNGKGYLVDYSLGVKRIDYQQADSQRSINVEQLRFFTDNHQPRKNAGNPHRGFFDAEHLNLTASMKLELDHADADSLHATLTQFTATDSVAGIDLRRLTATVAATKQGIEFTNVNIQQGSSIQLVFAQGLMRLPDKERGTSLAYSTSTITGNVLLRDIARPFAPALARFTLPLKLRTRMYGDNNTIHFTDVDVRRTNNALAIQASGYVHELKDPKGLHVHFDVSHMKTTATEAEQIINQFTVKKFMMEQLARLGQITYTGHFDVLWKRELFAGQLGTQAGNMTFDFGLDELTHHMSGHVKTDALQIGHVMDLPDIGPVAASASFKFDVSKERTAAVRRVKGGKLPIGGVKAHVDKASYKFISTSDLDVEINSDGAEAQGTLNAPHKFMDLGCSFSFTNTSEMHKMKIKPLVKLHL